MAEIDTAQALMNAAGVSWDDPALQRLTSLATCYGNAACLPFWIRTLTSHNGDASSTALAKIFNEVEHQGSHYEATTPVVRQLASLVLAEQIPLLTIRNNARVELSRFLKHLLPASRDAINIKKNLLDGVVGNPPTSFRTYAAGKLCGPFCAPMFGGDSEMGSWLNGQLHGEYQRRTVNHTVIAHGAYDHGRKTGEWTERWPNGAVKNVGAYIANKKTGAWKHFDDVGRVIAAGNYQDDKRHGTWTDPTGTHEWRKGVQR